MSVSLEVLAAFGLPAHTPVTALPGGHINETYKAESPRGAFVLQRINRFVFPQPEAVMENVLNVTEFLRAKLLRQGGDAQRGALTVYRAADGRGYFVDSAGEYWRCTGFLANTVARETAENLSVLREAGRAFGEFQNMLADYPAHTLHEIIPRFHHTPDRFRQLREAAEQNKAGRRAAAAEELDFACRREDSCALLTDMLDRGELPLRVTHNDTKLSNVLLDASTGKAVCVIDLDTVMPGLAAFDFGDSIRSGASTAAEDETDLAKVHFDLARFAAYTRGFLEACGSALTPAELRTLPQGAVLMTFEVGIRFLADYLNGDVYFRTAYPAHNLDRARNQFRLVEEMEAQCGAMADAVRQYGKA